MKFPFAEALKDINAQIAELKFGEKPLELYDPIRYAMALGGKRARPMACLLGHFAYQKDYSQALLMATAIEVFHNFTLVHDDIMDQAPLRRGKLTVYTKWNMPTAILSGDVMLVCAYQILAQIKDKNHREKLMARFSETAKEVCEGQQLDMNYETTREQTIEEYIEMIRLKTAVLLGFSFEAGAVLAGAGEEAKFMYEFGELIGLCFQIQDDWLDSFGDPEKFGKLVGGDILSNKKTFLSLTALKLADANQKKELNHWFTTDYFDSEQKVNSVLKIYLELNLKEKVDHKIDLLYAKAKKTLFNTSIGPFNKSIILSYADQLLAREN